jgi:hypothetical protein
MYDAAKSTFFTAHVAAKARMQAGGAGRNRTPQSFSSRHGKSIQSTLLNGTEQ